MSNVRYAVANLYLYRDELNISILVDDISDIKEAEAFREDYLYRNHGKSPQMIKVIQYEV